MNTSSVFFVAGAALKVHSFWLTWSIACLILLRKMTSLCIILMHFYGIQCNLTSTYSLIYGISSEYHASCTYLIAIIIFYQANQHSNDMKIEYIFLAKRENATQKYSRWMEWNSICQNGSISQQFIDHFSFVKMLTFEITSTKHKWNEIYVQVDFKIYKISRSTNFHAVAGAGGKHGTDAWKWHCKFAKVDAFWHGI